MLLPRAGAIGRVSEQPYGIAFDQTRNEGTLLVLDITDLAACRYGFVYVPWLEDDAGNAELGQPHYTALAANEYIDAQAQVKGYHPHNLGHPKEWVDSVLDQTGRFGVLPPGCLASLWPFHEAWAQSPDTKQASQRPMSSLKAVAFGSVIDTFLANALDVTLLDAVTGLPDFGECLRACMESRADAVAANPAAASELLQLAFAAEKHVDLSPYFGLTMDQIVAILQNTAIATSIDTLSLAAGTVTLPAEFVQLADALPPNGIRNFYLMELARRQDDTFDPSEAYHIMRTKVRDKIILGPVLSHSVRQIPWLDDTEISTGDFDARSVPSGLGMVRQLLLQNTNTSMMEKPLVNIVQLGDASLTPMRLVTGLMNLLHNRLESPSQASTCLSYALCFATASTSLCCLSSPEVIGLPTEAYAQTLRKEQDSGAASWTRLRHVDAHEWTLVVDCIDGLDGYEAVSLDISLLGLPDRTITPWTDAFRVAFVRLTSSSSATLSPEAVETLSLEGYLQRYAGSDFCREDLEAAIQRLQEKRNQWAQEILGDHDNVANTAAALSWHRSSLDRPVLSRMSATRACEMLREAAVQDKQAEAECAARATRSTCMKHRACTCQGRPYRV